MSHCQQKFFGDLARTKTTMKKTIEGPSILRMKTDLCLQIRQFVIEGIRIGRSEYVENTRNAGYQIPGTQIKAAINAPSVLIFCLVLLSEGNSLAFRYQCIEIQIPHSVGDDN